IGEVVDADHLDLAVRLERGAEEDAPDAAESVDADSNTHERAPCAGERYRVPGISRNYTATYNTRATVSTPTERAPTACSARGHRRRALLEHEGGERPRQRGPAAELQPLHGIAQRSRVEARRARPVERRRRRRARTTRLGGPTPRRSGRPGKPGALVAVASRVGEREERKATAG